MFNERNIPKLIIITPIFTIIVLVVLMLYLFVKAQRDYFFNESIELEKTYIEKQKIILKEEINNIFNYIDYHKNLMITNTKKNMEAQIYIFEKQISKKYKAKKDYKEYIRQNENANSDFIIYDKNTHTLIKNPDVFFNIQNVYLYNKYKKAFIIEDETTFYSFKDIPKKNIIVILKRDAYSDIDDLKYSIAKWTEQVRFKNNNYLTIHTNTNILLADPYRKDNIGEDDTNKKDGRGILYVQEFVKLAIKHKEGSFIEFFYPKPHNNQNIKKLNFVKLYQDWQWVISGGIYIDEIEKEVQAKKYALEQKINKYIKITLLITLFLIILISILSFLISKKINQTFQTYQKKVFHNETSLIELNNSLNDKIKLAITEAKQKDRAMLHQSRLARMGEMLSMIAHQWRQPLSQLSGIIMELETRVSFKKANEQFILNCTDDATKIIQHMSLTIEDFKNFFKPEKQKEDFYASEACSEVISLIEDTLINQNITLDFHVKNDKKIHSYKREYSQVILNLLLNAKDAIIINKIQSGRIELIVDTLKDLSIVAVKDNAGGIKSEHLDFIFEPYFSTKKSHGTGLGLYMSKMIIEQNMNGKIIVENSKKGATFKVVL